MMRLFISCVVLLLVASRPSLAQSASTDEEGHRLGGAISVGVGAGSLGIAMLGSLDLRLDQHLVTLRAAATTELFGDERWDVALLYGQSFDTGALSFEASAGIGVVIGEEGGTIYRDGSAIGPEPGLALQGGAFWRPTSFVAIGVLGFANVNGTYDFGGIAAALRLGQL